MERNVCGINTVAYRARRDRRTDRKVKTEGHKTTAVQHQLKCWISKLLTSYKGELRSQPTNCKMYKLYMNKWYRNKLRVYLQGNEQIESHWQINVQLDSEPLEGILSLGMPIFAPKWVRLAPNGTNPRLFQIRFQYILVSRPKCTEIWSEKVSDLSHLGPIWPILVPKLAYLTLTASTAVRFVLQFRQIGTK